jgi:hypothetical protein
MKLGTTDSGCGGCGGWLPPLIKSFSFTLLKEELIDWEKEPFVLPFSISFFGVYFYM